MVFCRFCAAKRERMKENEDQKCRELCDLPYLLEMLENAKASLRALGIDQSN